MIFKKSKRLVSAFKWLQIVLACFIFPAIAGEVDKFELIENAPRVNDIEAAKKWISSNRRIPFSSLKATGNRKTLLGERYDFQQYVGELPVKDAMLTVFIDKEVYLRSMHNGLIQLDQAESQRYVESLMTSGIGDNEALAIAWKNMRVMDPLLTIPKVTKLFVRDSGELKSAYEVSIQAAWPTGGFTQLLDAMTGQLLNAFSNSLIQKSDGPLTFASRSKAIGTELSLSSELARLQQKSSSDNNDGASDARGQIVRRVDGIGLVFDPDPRSSLSIEKLTDSSPAALFEPAYVERTLKSLKQGYFFQTFLSGPYVTLTDVEKPVITPTVSGTAVWNYRRGDSGFNDTMAYFHVDQSQRYVQSLGYVGATAIMNRSLNVDSMGMNGEDNAHYVPNPNPAFEFISFGTVCVDNVEDAAVILHEYAHAIQLDVTKWPLTNTSDMLAVLEGFADYWAASYVYSTTNGKSFHPDWVFKWDGHLFELTEECVKSLNRTVARTDVLYTPGKLYLGHQKHQEPGIPMYYSEELFSAPLYAAMRALVDVGIKREDVDRIIIEANRGLNNTLTMRDFAESVIATAKVLHPSQLSISSMFEDKYLAQNFVERTTPEIELNDSIADSQTYDRSGLTVLGDAKAQGDIDFYAVEVLPGHRLISEHRYTLVSSYKLELLNEQGNIVGQSTELSETSGKVRILEYNNVSVLPIKLYVRVQHVAGAVKQGSEYRLQNFVLKKVS